MVNDRSRIRRILPARFANSTGFYLFLGGVLVLCAGVLIYWNRQFHEQVLRDAFIRRAKVIAQEIDVRTFHDLAGSRSDLEIPGYMQLKRQLSATRDIFPDARFLYLMGRRADGSVFFYVDSEPPGSPDESPPGQNYADATDALLQVFSTGHPLVEGPVTDDWGEWISVLVPLVDPASGRTAAVLGMDIDAKDWERQITETFLLPSLLITALVVLILVGMVEYRYRASAPDSPRRLFAYRHSQAVFAGLLGLCVTALLTWYGHYFEQISRQEAFEQLVVAQSQLISSTLHEVERYGLDGLAKLFTSSDFVTRREFADFTTSLVDNPLVSIWGWVPEAAGEDIPAIEAAARADGLADFIVWSRESSGEAVPVPPRGPHYPLLYVAPFDPHNPALGYDLASEETRLAALLEAKRTGITTATDPIEFVHSPGNDIGITLFHPVADGEKPGSQIGFVTASVQASRLMRFVASKGLDHTGTLYMDFVQLRGGRPPIIFGSTSPAEMAQNHLNTNLREHHGVEFTTIHPIFVFGKAYALVAHPGPEFDRIYPLVMIWIIPISGAVLTLLLVRLVAFFEDRDAALAGMVKQRTEALQETERKFEVALKNSPVVVFQQDRELRYRWIHNPAPGFNSIEVIGKTDADLLPSDEAEQLTKIKRRVLETGTGDRQVVVTTIEGKAYYYDLFVDPVRDSTGTITGVICSSIDITERKAAEILLRDQGAKLAHSNRQLGRIYRVLEALILGASRDVAGLGRLLVDRIAEELGADCVGLYLHNREKRVLELLAISPEETGGMPGKIFYLKDADIYRRAVEDQETVCIHDFQDRTGPAMCLGRARSLLLLPLVVTAQVSGVICIVSERPDFDTEEYDQLLGVISSHGAIVLETTRLMQRTREQVDRLAALKKIDEAIKSNLDIRMMADVLLAQIRDQLEADAVNILLFDPVTQNLNYFRGIGFKRAMMRYTRAPLGFGSPERAVDGKLIHLKKSELAAFFRSTPQITDEGFVEYYGAPLITKGKLSGMLEVFYRTIQATDENWIEYFRMLANQAAIAIDSAELFESLQRSINELTLAYDENIEAWSRALSLREGRFDRGSKQEELITLELAKAYGISGQELGSIRRGALLHDIGMIGVPERILLKPGALDEAEWELVRRHPKTAFDLLSPIGFLKGALDIPYCHHEKWDGSGYPQGLKGEQIPIAARLFAIADVWDALTSERPYRPAGPERKAIEYIRDQAGKHFDPQIVELFLNSRFIKTIGGRP